MGVEGVASSPLFVRVSESKTVVAWLEDGSVLVFNVNKDNTLAKRHVLSGHIQGKK